MGINECLRNEVRPKKKKKYAVQVGVSEVYVHVSLPTEWNQIPEDFMPIYPRKKPHLQKV